jgi:DNA-binding protein H-NS
MGKTTMKRDALKSMSFDDLIALRTEIDALLAGLINDEKRALEAKIAKLSQLPEPSKPDAFRRSTIVPQTGPARSSKVPARFYNPDNPSEKWSGRGLRPRWMVAALAAGRSLEDMILDDDTGLPKIEEAKPQKRARAK